MLLLRLLLLLLLLRHHHDLLKHLETVYGHQLSLVRDTCASRHHAQGGYLLVISWHRVNLLVDSRLVWLVPHFPLALVLLRRLEAHLFHQARELADGLASGGVGQVSVGRRQEFWRRAAREHLAAIDQLAAVREIVGCLEEITQHPLGVWVDSRLERVVAVDLALQTLVQIG